MEWVGAAGVAGAQGASCKAGRSAEQTTGILVEGRQQRLEEEGAGSWAGGQGSPGGWGAWRRVDRIQGDRRSGKVAAGGIACSRSGGACSHCGRRLTRAERGGHSGRGGPGEVPGGAVPSGTPEGGRAGQGGHLGRDHHGWDGMT